MPDVTTTFHRTTRLISRLTTHLDIKNRPVNRGQAVAVRRRVIDEQGHIVTEKIRHKIPRMR